MDKEYSPWWDTIKKRTIESALELAYFPNNPRDFLFIVVIKKDNMEGETLYDGQSIQLYRDPKYRYLLDMPCKGMMPELCQNACLQMLFV